MSFTWFNVNASYNNQLIRYSKDKNNTFTNISFPGGVWSYENFDDYIKKKTVIKQSGKKDEFPIICQ